MAAQHEQKQTKREMITTTTIEATGSTGKRLLGAQALLETVWPNPIDRPSMRWLQYQKAKRAIPFIKLGAFVWYDPEEVRAEIAARHTIKARGAA
jgi:hypothetical protein